MIVEPANYIGYHIVDGGEVAETSGVDCVSTSDFTGTKLWEIVDP